MLKTKQKHYCNSSERCSWCWTSTLSWTWYDKESLKIMLEEIKKNDVKLKQIKLENKPHSYS